MFSLDIPAPESGKGVFATAGLFFFFFFSLFLRFSSRNKACDGNVCSATSPGTGPVPRSPTLQIQNKVTRRGFHQDDSERASAVRGTNPRTGLVSAERVIGDDDTPLSCLDTAAIF